MRSSGKSSVSFLFPKTKFGNDYPNQKIIRVVGTKNLDVKKSNYYEITPEQFKEIYDSAN